MTTSRKINLRFKLIPLLFLLLISCTQTLPETGKAIPQIPETCWLLKPAIYRLRQSAKLEYQDKEEIFEGFMELDLKQNRVHLIIFTALGVTLLDLEINYQDFSFPKNSAAPNRGSKRFAQAVATAVQHIFLTLKNHSNQDKNQPPITIKLNHNPAEISGLSPAQPHPDWDVTYHDYRDYPCGRLPQRIILQSRKPAYKLTVWLHAAREIEK